MSQSGSSKLDLETPTSNVGKDPSDLLKLPLTTRSVTIRSDLVDSSGHSLTWNEAIRRLKWSLQRSKVHPVIRNKDTGERFTNYNKSPRNFTGEWVNWKHSQILDADRELCERYGDPHTTFVTLTGTSYENGQHMAPLDHYFDLDSSWKQGSGHRPICDSIDYYLSDKKGLEWEYLAIDGPHPHPASDNRCYPHRHILVYADGPIDKSDFRGAIDAHLKYSDVAREPAHELDKAVRVERVEDMGRYPIGQLDRSRGLVTPAARDLSEHLPRLEAINGNLIGKPTDKLFSTLMFATKKQMWKPSNGFSNAYRDRWERRNDCVYPTRRKSTSEAEFEEAGIETDDGRFIPKEQYEDNDSGGMTVTESIEGYYD